MKKIKGGITAPNGFLQSAVNSGIKKKNLDLALIMSEKEAVCAGVFTTNAFKAASVVVTKEQLDTKAHRAIIINSGNANCLTGKKGIVDAKAIISSLSSLIGCKPNQILICSTGIIGKRLPAARIKRALPSLAASMHKVNSHKAAKGIMTTDTFSKEIAYSFKVGKGLVRVAGIAKGAGMIQPNMATMISLITTDAKINKPLLQKALKDAVEDSFNNITVDGDMSTNDTVLVMANGLSGVKISSPSSYKRFVSALKALCLELSKMIVRDGEGATKFIEIEVKQAKTKADAKQVALAIANSNLFKAMCYGNDPNFGRVAAGCGAA